jgi:hypothetical protein
MLFKFPLFIWLSYNRLMQLAALGPHTALEMLPTGTRNKPINVSGEFLYLSGRNMLRVATDVLIIPHYITH